MDQALSGIKVIDLTHFIAGPYCSKLLADGGADVVKVEWPPQGDGARHVGPFPNDEPHPEKSGLFLYLNSNKRGITLNLKSEAGREVFKDLVKWADVLVENFAPRVMPGWGLSYETLREMNPGLVVTSISNFGQTGPYRNYEATEIVLQAMSGLMYVTGDRDKEPLRYSLNQAQYIAGANAAAATMIAQYMAETTGQGQHADISIVETIAGSYHGFTGQYSYAGAVTSRGRNNMYPCRDGYILPNMGERNTWDFYVKFLGALELADERFQTPGGRERYEEEVNRAMERALAARGRYEWLYEGQAQWLVLGAMQTIEDLTNCPHLACRRYLITQDHPEVGPLTYPGRPFGMTESPYHVRRPAPHLGEHNEEVYGALGYSSKDLARLRAMDAI